MARPEVTVSAPRYLFVGQDASIEVEVAASKRTQVEFIDATLTGTHGWTVGSGKSQVSYRETSPRLGVRLMEGGELAENTTRRFTAHFTLPPGTPPTHDMQPAWMHAKLRVHVSIPWALDRRSDYDLAVRLPPPTDLTRAPYAATTERGAMDQPRIEVGLASRRLVAGEVMEGTCALFHLDDTKARDVALEIVPSFSLFGRGNHRERRGDATVATLVMPAGSAGRSVPFQLRLPLDLVPSFASSTHALAWFLIARTGSFFSTKAEVVVPIEILDASAEPYIAAQAAAPRLGDERMASVFDAFAHAHGWHATSAAAGGEAGSASAGDEHISIAREAHDSQLGIGYAYRGTTGAFLVARIHHPSLGLGLAVTPSTARDLFFHDVEVAIAEWDRAHHVDARAADQAIPFLRIVAAEQLRSHVLGSLVRWNDDELVYERAIVTADAAELERVAARLELLAAVIARAAGAIEPPTRITTDVARWRELARAVDGVFTPGELGVRGKLNGLPVDLALVWTPTGTPASVRVAVGDPELTSGEARDTVLALDEPALAWASAPPQLADLLTTWSTDLRHLAVRDGVASVSLTLPVVVGPVPVDADRVHEVVLALGAVLAALDPARGPYR